MLIRRLTFPFLMLFFTACSNSTEEKNHFPINAFLEEELAQIDSFPIAIIHTRETNEKTDTSVVDKKDFRALVMQLVGIDFQEKKHKNNYEELVLEDVQLGNISIGYTKTNKIKSIFAERKEREGQKMLIRKILWTSATEMMVNTSYYKEGQLLNNLTERYNWAIGN